MERWKKLEVRIIVEIEIFESGNGGRPRQILHRARFLNDLKSLSKCFAQRRLLAYQDVCSLGFRQQMRYSRWGIAGRHKKSRITSTQYTDDQGEVCDSV